MNNPTMTLHLVTAVQRLLDLCDETTSNSEGHYPDLDPGCVDCTEGCTPRSADTGLCGYHYGKQVMRLYTQEKALEAQIAVAVNNATL